MTSLQQIQQSIKPIIIGIDEVGTGALAGPLVVCGVKAPKNWSLLGLNDSKKLSPKKRAALRLQLTELILKNEIQYHLAERSNQIIDQNGLAATLKDAYLEVFKALYSPECLIICDGNLKFDNASATTYDQVSLAKADTLIPTVMAGSILAKTYRDHIMKTLSQQFPIYDWENNVGYGSAKHLSSLKKEGPCSLHRFSYAPVKKLLIK